MASALVATELQQVECLQCASARTCLAKSERCRLVLMAWAHDRLVADCPQFVMRCYHGLDGVAAFPRAPFDRQLS